MNRHERKLAALKRNLGRRGERDISRRLLDGAFEALKQASAVALPDSHPAPVEPDLSVRPDLVATDGAEHEGCRAPDESEHGLLLADIEARLTDEVRGLITALRQFSSRTQLISQSTPAGADFTKLVTQTLALMALQLAIALGKSLEKPVLFDDGVLYLKNLGLNLNDFVREVELDGRRFLAVALVDQQPSKLDNAADAGNEG